jgi:hypothetical protein
MLASFCGLGLCQTETHSLINTPVSSPQKWANELNRAFSKGKVQMAKKHMKKFSPTPVIKKMQIKTLLRFHLTPVRITTIKITNNNKCWQACWKKGALIHCWWECKLVQPLWKIVWRLLKKLKTDLPYDPAIPFSGIYLKECESAYNKSICMPMFIAF